MTGSPARSSGIVVQKFGGTSVASPEGRAALATKVRAALERGDRCVVVVSAMGRAGSPYATDTLLGLLDGHEAVPRESDMLAACGEVITAVLVAHELRSHRIPAMAFTGAEAGVLTDEQFGNATVLAVDPEPLTAALAAGLTPVVTGFQGATAAGETTTLGRGGSDTSACAIGASLHADAVEIYTDVDGVMTADPRTCEGVRVLDAIQFEELFQMAKHGAKVMHAPAAEVAMDAGVPVWVRNTYSSARGTLVASAEVLEAERLRRVATAVSHTDGVARVILRTAAAGHTGSRMSAMTTVFRAMADAGVSLDMFTPVVDVLAFSFDESQLLETITVLDDIALDYEIETDLAKVTLVGAGMHGVPGIMARVAEALEAADVEVLQIADSHYTISVLVHHHVRREAIRALHDEFGLGS